MFDYLRRWAEQNPLILALWVFGSRARCDHRPDSDLDLCVVLETEEGFYGPRETFRFHREHWQSELAMLCGCEVSMFPFGETHATMNILPEWVCLKDSREPSQDDEW